MPSLMSHATSVVLCSILASISQAVTLTWDAAGGDGVTITAGSGNWNTTAGNAVWNNAGSNEIWSQTAISDASNVAVFGGADGTANQYVVTIADGATIAAESLTFNNSGYLITGGNLALRPTTTANGGITVAANKSATINSAIVYANNAVVTNTINGGATLNLGGGAANSQYTFNGAGIVNITGGTYEANTGAINVGNFNVTGGTYNLTPGTTNGYTFGNAVGRNVNVSVSGTGSLTLNNTSNNTTATAPFIAVGNNTGNTSFTTSLTVQSGGTVTVGTQASRAGEIRISNSGNANGLLDVKGGAVNVGTGNTANQIYLFKNGATAGYNASMTQSGGTVKVNGIQFGGASGTYESGSSANLTLTGGSLYIGSAGITRGSGASALPTSIKLEGGTLGADQNWSSSLDMQLGTSGGVVNVRTQDAGSNSRNITLSGILSNVSGVSGSLLKSGSGTLTLSGANTFNGGLNIQSGTVNATTSNSALGTGTVTMGGAGSNGATLTAGRSHSNNFTINAPDSGSLVIGANGAGSGYTLSGGISLNGNLTIRTFNNTIDADIKASAGITGGISGTGNVLLNNLGLAANTITITVNAINHNGSLTLQGTATGDTTIGAIIGTNITSVNQNSSTSRLVLSGSNTYSGATNVNAGTLVVNGSIANSSLTTVSSTATLGGSGTIGNLTVLDGGYLAPGNSPGTLNTGTLSLSSISMLSFELNPLNNSVGSNINDLINVTGDLTLDGILNVVPTSGDFLQATLGAAWRLFNYSGALTNNIVTLGSVPALSGGLNWEVRTSTPGQVNLVVIPEPGSSVLTGLSLSFLMMRRKRIP